MNKLKNTAKGAWARSRKIDAKPRGGGGFPPNMKGLVAACQSYKFAETETKGDPYFSLTCIVKDPAEMDGRRATFMWFINDGEWATVEDNLNQLANDLQLLEEEMPEDVCDVKDVLASLCERGVHLIFNTGSPRKNGRPPNLFIQGLADKKEFPDDPQEGAGEAPARQSGGHSSSPKDEPPADDQQTDDQGGDDSGGGTSEAQAEDDTPWVPAKGDQYNYQSNGKTVLVEVTAVDKKKQTYDLKAPKLKPPKTFKGIKWFDKEGNPTVEAVG